MKNLSFLTIVLFFTITSYANAPKGDSAFLKENSLDQNTVTREVNMANFIGIVYYLTCANMELLELREFDNYLLNLPLPEGMTVEELFSANGELIQNMRIAGKRMIRTSFNMFDREDADIAYGRALELGATNEQANKIRSNFTSGSVNLKNYGKELVWLADVLPSYVAGDERMFYDSNTATEARRTMRQTRWMFENFIDISELQQTMSATIDYVRYEIALLVYYALYY